MGFGIMMQGGRIMNLSEKLLKLRKQSGLSQQELADQLNVSRQSVSKWELNESVPDISNILALSEIYHVSTDYLLKDSIENDTKENRIDLMIVISTCIVFIGLLSAYMLWKHYQNSICLLVGMLIQIIGIIVFEIFALPTHQQKYQRKFFSINIWLLCFIPIFYMSEYTITYQLIYNKLHQLIDGSMSSILLFYLPTFLSLLLSFIIFVLIRKYIFKNDK